MRLPRISRKSAVEVQAARAFNLKNYPRAIDRLTELLELVGENPHTLHMLALCHFRQDDDGQALALARRALLADGRHLESLKLLARLHFLRGEHSQARLHVARALALHDTAEDRQWLEWAEAFMAAPTASDDDIP
ncbi:MAG: hypothetical protein E2O65_06950 [Gammaproteobacteria bacterium]|nr:MAG: hypothetical protein E2O65_06950 [Gammaproteobacteria bacterium]